MRMSIAVHAALASIGTVGFSAGVGLSGARAAIGDIHNLGTLGGGISEAYGINASGQVVGYTTTPGNGYYHAFRFDGMPGNGGVMRDLGTFGSDTIAYGINASGQVAGGSWTKEGDLHAFRYDGTPGSGGIMRDLGTLGGSGSQGCGVNSSGQVAGFAAQSDDAFRAFRYDGTPGSGGIMHDLGILEIFESAGYAINDAGQVAGDAYTISDFGLHAFRYDGTPGSGGVMRDLGTLGGTYSSGYAINAAGQVAGEAYIADNAAHHAFRYDGTPGNGGVMRDLGALDGTNSTAYAMNDAGFIVGEADSGAALWRADLSAVDLNAWLDAANPELGGYWYLESARGINDAGWIVGTGEYNDGPGGLSDGTRAFLLDGSSLVPELSGSVVITLSVPAMLSRRRRATNRKKPLHLSPDRMIAQSNH